ncbi:MAG: 16S rRNA (uracil(1498)-N(3))-methyltransferase [Endomicrobium sp.]|jgi:16S rRNA (uracil1498-N3)-methyltransferase|nr:16S rRNA (uracil(1498)-N(3))-methyltransferase [Endomicrobium sp.]
MTHFYVNSNDIRENTFSMRGEQAHYISNVRRFKPNDEITIFDGIGNSYKTKITSISKNEITGIILSYSHKMPNFIIKLYTAIPKGNRFEWLIEKCAEIGVSEITPVTTKRSLDISFSENKLKRYEKISITASSQCERNDIMKIKEPINFKSACKNAIENKQFINILPWENETSTFSLNSLFSKQTFLGANIFIGPEGGFENEEIELAKSLGIHTITLGDNILRIETAAVIASAFILNYKTVLPLK